jgi:hypothetical protein
VGGAPGGVSVVRVHNDDVHTFEQVTGSLRRHCHAPRLSEAQARALTNSVHYAGSGEVGCAPTPEALSICRGLRADQGLLVSVAPQWARLARREAAAAVCIEWLHRTTLKSKHLAALACDALLRPAPEWFVRLQGLPGAALANPAGADTCTCLSVLLLHNDLLPRTLVQRLHDLYLTLFTVEEDKCFRRAFAVEFVRAYRRTNVLWTDGVGTQDEATFGLAVQLFTVPSLLPMLAATEDVIGTVLLSLRDMLSVALKHPPAPGGGDDGAEPQVALDHHCITHTRYRHATQDLVHILRCNECMPRLMLARPELLECWFDALGLVQVGDAHGRALIHYAAIWVIPPEIHRDRSWSALAAEIPSF